MLTFKQKYSSNFVLEKFRSEHNHPFDEKIADFSEYRKDQTNVTEEMIGYKEGICDFYLD